ncbi:unannotated protein [freshwater metagenome]|uniref:Unannotated protein n=1 Tax=freshwater metagenome TaxID=449393 RepID=A0A6J7EUR7_9ZZZZ
MVGWCQTFPAGYTSPATRGTACGIASRISHLASRISLGMLMQVSRRVCSGSSTGTPSTGSGANPSRNWIVLAVDVCPLGLTSTGSSTHRPEISNAASVPWQSPVRRPTFQQSRCDLVRFGGALRRPRPVPSCEAASTLRRALRDRDGLRSDDQANSCRPLGLRTWLMLKRWCSCSPISQHRSTPEVFVEPPPAAALSRSRAAAESKMLWATKDRSCLARASRISAFNALAR